MIICVRGRQRSAEIRKTQESPLGCSHLTGWERRGCRWAATGPHSSTRGRLKKTIQGSEAWADHQKNFVQSHQTGKGHSRQVFRKMWQVLLGIWRSIGQTWAWLCWPEHQQDHPLAAWLSGHMPKPSAKGFALGTARLPEIRKFILIRSQNYHIPVFLF